MSLQSKISAMIAEQVDFANAQLARLRTEYAAAKGQPETQESLKDDMNYWTQCAISLAANQAQVKADKEPDGDEAPGSPSDYDADNASSDPLSPDSVISVFSSARPLGMH